MITKRTAEALQNWIAALDDLLDGSNEFKTLMGSPCKALTKMRNAAEHLETCLKEESQPAAPATPPAPASNG